MEACLRSIVGGSYPSSLLEIIVIDDFSEDETAAVASRFPVRLIRLADFLPKEANAQANKKKAIEIGIAHARGELIVTTDADCVVPMDWLRLIVSASENQKAKIVCAPVAFHREKNLLQRFQSLDFLGLMGITAAGVQLGWQRMGNGANLAYRKAVFEELGGFSGNAHLASGDDVFLVQKVAARWPGSVFFLKNFAATVLTEAPPDVPSFIRQRLRWGTKNAALTEWPLRLVLLTVFLFCWSILINSVLAVVGIFTGNGLLLAVVLAQIFAKATFDHVFLREVCRFFKRKDLLRWFVPSFLLHTLYIPALGTASLFFKKYTWKGRRSQ